MTSKFRVEHLSDTQLVQRLRAHVAQHNVTTAELLAHLSEVDARRLFCDEACGSLFDYCVKRLGFSEPATSKRITAARLARRFPIILEMLAGGELHLSALMLLSKHLTEENHLELLGASSSKSKREIERDLAERFPAKDVPATIRKVPQRAGSKPTSPVEPATTPGDPLAEAVGAANTEPSSGRATKPVSSGQSFALSAPPKPAPRGVVTPLAPQRYKIQFTARQDLRDKLEQAQELLRHQIPDGDLAQIFDRALSLLVAEVKKKRFGVGRARRARKASKSKQGKARSRHIPAHVKRTVYERDGGRCTFVDATGRRCETRGGLELHHLHAFGKGGENHVDNLALACKGHNAHAARRDYGADAIARAQRRRSEHSAANTEPS